MTLALCFDTETTGLVNNKSKKLEEQPECIEFACHLVDLETGEIKLKYDQLFKPTKGLPPEITKITGIKPEDLIAAPFIVDKIEHIAKLISNADVVIAHNCSFDYNILNFEFMRYQEKVIWPRRICTVEQSMHIRGYRLKLKELYRYLFSEDFSGAHRADSDVDALVRVSIELNKRKWLL